MKVISILCAVSLFTCVAWAEESKGPSTVNLDQPLPFVLLLKSVEVYPKTADNKRWDNLLAGKPDLILQVFANGHQVLVSKVRENTESAEWELLVSEPFSLSASNASIEIIVLDKDLKDNDLIGKVSFKPTTQDAVENKMFTLAGGQVKELKVVLSEAQSVEVKSASKVKVKSTPEKSLEAPSPATQIRLAPKVEIKAEVKVVEPAKVKPEAKAKAEAKAVEPAKAKPVKPTEDATEDATEEATPAP